MKNAAAPALCSSGWFRIPLIAVLMIAGCSRDFLPKTPSDSRSTRQIRPSQLSAKRLLADGWYRHFLKKNQRKPVIELIQTPVSDPFPARWLTVPQTSPIFLSVQQTQISLLDSFPPNVKEALLSSEKVELVTTRIRKITHLERFFQMRHASASSAREPGQVRGADYALVITPSVTVPVVQRSGFRVFATWAVSFELQLVDLGSDNELWSGEVRLFYNGRTGNLDGFLSSSNPRSEIVHLRVLHNRWVRLD